MSLKYEPSSEPLQVESGSRFIDLHTLEREYENETDKRRGFWLAGTKLSTFFIVPCIPWPTHAKTALCRKHVDADRVVSIRTGRVREQVHRLPHAREGGVALDLAGTTSQKCAAVPRRARIEGS